MIRYLGVDPGLSGAIAAYDPAVDTLVVYDVPTLKLTVAGKQRRRLDAHSLARVAVELAAGCKLAVVEDVHAMPKQGVASSFSFGFVAGAIQQALIAAGAPLQLVQPAAWKRYFGLTHDKDATRLHASRLMPKHAHLWPKRSHDGRAEAALLALYGSKTYGSIFS